LIVVVKAAVYAKAARILSEWETQPKMPP
jgi:hypothetical protein